LSSKILNIWRNWILWCQMHITARVVSDDQRSPQQAWPWWKTSAVEQRSGWEVPRTSSSRIRAGSGCPPAMRFSTINGFQLSSWCRVGTPLELLPCYRGYRRRSCRGVAAPGYFIWEIDLPRLLAGEGRCWRGQREWPSVNHTPPPPHLPAQRGHCNRRGWSCRWRHSQAQYQHSPCAV
jgi:hypothetical protein